tara:strand:- start:1229 stop:1642 length:414 start_codon:yes stop_codon:yes gene_type:complete
MSDVLTDSGFADAEGARAVLRRMRLREGLRSVESSARALRKLLDKARQVDAGAVSPCECQRLDLSEGDVAGIIERTLGVAADSKDVREDELLEGIDLVLQLLDRIGVGLEHGLFSLEHADEAKSAAENGHRLCGDAK